MKHVFRIFRLKFATVFSLILFFLFSLFSIGQIKAQGIVPLLVAPTTTELNLSPGQSSVADVKFFNRGDTPISGSLKVADFIVVNKDGDPIIIDNPDQANPKFAASRWFTLPFNQITIAPNSKVEVQAKINVPQDVKAGGRYAAIYFEPGGVLPLPGQSKQEKGLAVSARIASLVYIKIPGPITENAIVSDFFVKSFNEYGPVEVDTEIINRGDYHISPKGFITLTNLLGGVVSQSKLENRNIFPDAALDYKTLVGRKWMFGRYRVDLNVGYGDQGKTISSSAYFWVLPWRLIVIIVLSIVILFLLIQNLMGRSLRKNLQLEKEVIEEKSEIEKLKDQLRKRSS